jgi:hypothetical protein
MVVAMEMILGHKVEGLQVPQTHKEEVDFSGV